MRTSHIQYKPKYTYRYRQILKDIRRVRTQKFPVILIRRQRRLYPERNVFLVKRNKKERRRADPLSLHKNAFHKNTERGKKEVAEESQECIYMNLDLRRPRVSDWTQFQQINDTTSAKYPGKNKYR